MKAFDETEKAISNLLRAIGAGIYNESTKDRMDTKVRPKAVIAAANLKGDLGLKKEHIMFFLKQFADMDYGNLACKKRLIKNFINSVFICDDEVLLTFHYSGDHRTMTLEEIDDACCWRSSKHW